MNCPSILAFCEDQYLQDQEQKLLEKIIVEENLKQSLEFCQTLHHENSKLDEKRINKRSAVAKKRGGSKGSSRSGTRGRGRLSSNIRSVFSGNPGRKSQKALSGILGSKKGTFGTGRKIAKKGVKRKGGFLKKAGKYVVIGLAGMMINILRHNVSRKKTLKNYISNAGLKTF